MQKLCKNCKYYSPSEWEEEKGFGGCECPKFKYGDSYNWKEKRIRKR